MPYRKKLIEVALPLDAINAESAREKTIHTGLPANLHTWWARKPLAACRAVLFASLVDDPAEPEAPRPYLAALDDLPKPDPLPLLWDGMTVAEQRRERVFNFIARLVKWENLNDQQIIGTARELIDLACEGNPPPVLDPFCGGGSIPLEAQRLGLEAHASDLNPVAVLITKALTEIPPKFANRPPVNPEDRAKLGGAGAWKGAAGLSADVRYYGKRMRDEAERRIGRLYAKAQLPNGGVATVVAWLWARSVRCPNPACGAEMPLVSKWALSTKAGQEAWVEPQVDRSVSPPLVRFEVKTGQPTGTDARRSGAGTGLTNDRGKRVQATFLCAACTDGIARGEYIDEEADAGRMGTVPMAVVVEGVRERQYLPFAFEMTAATDEAAHLARELRGQDKLPTAPCRGTFASNAQGRIYGFKTFADYFTPRQVVALTTFSDLVGEGRERAQRDAAAAGLQEDDVPLAEGGAGARAYGEAVATFLALGVDRLAQTNNGLVRWLVRSTGTSKGTPSFDRQAVQMVWEFSEGNPFGSSVGSWGAAISNVLASFASMPSLALAAQVSQENARRPPSTGLRALVCTDPPYYDNIGYADLSDFFYVWLRRALYDIYPELFRTMLAPRAGDLLADDTNGAQ